MSKNDPVYLGHMLDSAEKAHAKVEGITRTEFDEDENLRLALVHLVQIIGEAAGRVSENFRNGHPEIPWLEIIRMRHKVVHDYLGVDEDIVWEVVLRDLPPLIQALQKLVPTSNPS